MSELQISNLFCVLTNFSSQYKAFLFCFSVWKYRLPCFVIKVWRNKFICVEWSANIQLLFQLIFDKDILCLMQLYQYLFSSIIIIIKICVSFHYDVFIIVYIHLNFVFTFVVLFISAFCPVHICIIININYLLRTCVQVFF